MTIYIASIILILIIRVYYNNIQLFSKKKSFIVFSLTPIFVMLSMKNTTIGADTVSYNRMFYVAKYSSLEYGYERLEIGYKFFLDIISKIFSNSQWQYIIVGFFLVISFGIFIYKYSKEPTLAIIFYMTLGLFAFNLSGIRQSIAMAICLFSYKYIQERKLLKFLLIIIFAGLFHKSSIFFIPAWFIAFKKINTTNIFINFIVGIAILAFSKPLMLATSTLLELEYGIESTNSGRIFFLIVMVITILSLIYRKNLLQTNPNNIIFINLNFISAILWGMRLISRTAERPSFYYLFATIILLEQILVSLKNNQEKQLLIYVSVILSCILFIYRLSGSMIYPYSFYTGF